jgi:hypothetical protein
LRVSPFNRALERGDGDGSRAEFTCRLLADLLADFFATLRADFRFALAMTPSPETLLQKHNSGSN